MSYISPALTLIISAVKKAAGSVNRDFNEIESLQSSVKNHKEFVVASYTKIEKALRVELGKVRPDWAVITDNSPLKDSCFVVSPIDGLSNFAHGVPYFSVSVAVVDNGVVQMGIVYNPANDELYFAEKGKGAYKEGFRNHERLRVSGRKELSEALISSLVNYDKDVQEYLTVSTAIVNACDNIRVFGAISLDLAYIASGKLDAGISIALPFNNFAAGLLLVKEAGGYIYDINQPDIRTENIGLVMASGNLVATNAQLGSKVFALLKK